MAEVVVNHQIQKQCLQGYHFCKINNHNHNLYNKKIKKIKNKYYNSSYNKIKNNKMIIT